MVNCIKVLTLDDNMSERKLTDNGRKVILNKEHFVSLDNVLDEKIKRGDVKRVKYFKILSKKIYLTFALLVRDRKYGFLSP